MATLVDYLVPDRLWAIVEPLLPAPPRPPYGGRHRAVPDRNCFAAIVYMARTSTHGGCYRPTSSAAARRRPAGAA
jgi:transposase